MEFKYYFYSTTKQHYLNRLDSKTQIKFEIDTLMTFNNRRNNMYIIVSLGPLEIDNYSITQYIYVDKINSNHNNES